MRRALLLMCLVMAQRAAAQISRRDWIGKFAMEADGRRGTLTIAGSPVKCGANDCTVLEARYSDDQGNELPVTVETVGQKGQHLGLSMQATFGQEHLDVYLFSQDKTRFAGTGTTPAGTVGVSGTREDAGVRPAAASSVAAKLPAARRPVIAEDGSITVKNADGSTITRHIGQCGGVVHEPNGHVVRLACAAVPMLMPPDPPAGSDQSQWLSAEDQLLVNAIQSLLDAASFKNYEKNYDGDGAAATYQKLYFHAKTVAELTAK